MTNEEIKTYIAQQKWISLGTRSPDMLEAKLKIIGWSLNSKKSFGVGYHTMLINSIGKQFADRNSWIEIDTYFQNKDFAFAKEYIEKMAKLNEELYVKIKNNVEIDVLKELSWLFTHFRTVRWVIEDIYEKCTQEEQRYIDDWRNNTDIFSSLELYNEKYPHNDPSEWTVVLINGEIHELTTILAPETQLQKQTDSKEIKGKTGYQGKVIGKARILTSDNLAEFVEGEIIVATMTTIDFMPIISKAAAFVTDEGGVTCHAAIVAREMKKPCVIGTRYGTHIIKTGDMVEVDAEKGIVKIIN